jgi:hypothetical protein
MPNFDTDTLEVLRTVPEITVCTHKHSDQAVPIWVVVADDKVFVRSAYGTRGRWYRDLVADGTATLSACGRELHAQAVPENEPDAIAAVSREYLRKYGTGPYAQAMVKPDVLAHTLRLEPR